MRKQQRDLHAGVTEDDMNEIKQDISGLRFFIIYLDFFKWILELFKALILRFELLEIFKTNDFKVDVDKQTQSKIFKLMPVKLKNQTIKS
jgi:hypothetical protein